jgi:nucleoside 2-deoxyribosyltransferase
METKTLTVYSAGPEGFAEPTRAYMFGPYQALLKTVFTGGVINPWELTSDAEVMAVISLPSGPDRVEKLAALHDLIGQRNANGIERANTIVANLEDDDSGTGSEIGYGAALGNFLFGMMTDIRRSADIDPFIAYLIERSGGEIVRKLGDLSEAVARGAARGPHYNGAARATSDVDHRKPTVFFGGLMGYTEGTEWFWQTTLRPALEEAGLKVTRQRDLPQDNDLGAEIAAAIEAADLVVVDLDRQEIPIGTAAIAGFAYGYGKPVFGYRSDFRASGEEGAGFNLQVKYFVLHSGGAVVNSTELLVSSITAYLDAKA